MVSHIYHGEVLILCTNLSDHSTTAKLTPCQFSKDWSQAPEVWRNPASKRVWILFLSTLTKSPRLKTRMEILTRLQESLKRRSFWLSFSWSSNQSRKMTESLFLLWKQLNSSWPPTTSQTKRSKTISSRSTESLLRNATNRKISPNLLQASECSRVSWDQLIRTSAKSPSRHSSSCCTTTSPKSE